MFVVSKNKGRSCNQSVNQSKSWSITNFWSISWSTKNWIDDKLNERIFGSISISWSFIKQRKYTQKQIHWQNDRTTNWFQKTMIVKNINCRRFWHLTNWMFASKRIWMNYILTKSLKFQKIWIIRSIFISRRKKTSPSRRNMNYFRNCSFLKINDLTLSKKCIIKSRWIIETFDKSHKCSKNFLNDSKYARMSINTFAIVMFANNQTFLKTINTINCSQFPWKKNHDKTYHWTLLQIYQKTKIITLFLWSWIDFLKCVIILFVALKKKIQLFIQHIWKL